MIKVNYNILKFIKSKVNILLLSTILLISVFDVLYIKENFNQDLNSLILYAFGGIPLNNIMIIQVSRRIVILSIFCYLLLDFLGFSNERDYLLIIRYLNRRTYLNSKLFKIIIFIIFFSLFISITYIFFAFLLLNNSTSTNFYVKILYNIDSIPIKKIIIYTFILNMMNLINISLFSYLIKLYTNKSHLAIISLIATNLISVFSQDTVLKWTPFSVGMTIRLNEIVGTNSNINFMNAIIICTVTSSFLLVLLNIKVNKIEIL